MARVRLRVYLGGDHPLGPGKVQLLEAVQEHGSISAAARSMGMAYRHAWEMIDDLNHCFRKPVVSTAAGGHRGGGARLTRFGAAVVRRFRAMERATLSAIRRDVAALESEVSPSGRGRPARRAISQRE